MQKIIINNFGAVKNAEIDIKKVLILIGEQASGKSTIAKLIYFFRSLRDDLIVQIVNDISKESFNAEIDFLEPLCDAFYNLFGSTYHLPNFEITFYYSVEEDKYIRLTLDKDKKLNPKLSVNFFKNELKNELGNVRKSLKLIEKEENKVQKIFNEVLKSDLQKKVFNSIKNALNVKQTDNLFIVAGRMAAVNYSDLFEKYLFSSIENKVIENTKQLFKFKTPTIDLELMSRFIERVSTIKDYLKKWHTTEIDFGKSDNLTIVQKQMELILKGRYIIDDLGEKILIRGNNNANGFVYLSNASSGQQEVVRILQDLLMLMVSNEKISRIIEEPEAHLFPIAQKQLVELFALMVNQDIDNQLIITTHSPYILAAFNNLLFAKRVIEKNPNAEGEVSKIVAPEFRLDANEFAAYSLSYSVKDEYCTSIMSDRGLISENYLDTVSDILSEDFEVLYDIHSKTYARK
jgi:predicted ATPase